MQLRHDFQSTSCVFAYKLKIGHTFRGQIRNGKSKALMSFFFKRAHLRCSSFSPYLVDYVSTILLLVLKNQSFLPKLKYNLVKYRYF